jgi:Family of unknown function (DUF5343)
MFGIMAKVVRPPYASGEGIRALFTKMKSMGPPKGKVDATWIDNYGIQKSQPHAILGLLRWLTVIDGDGKVDEKLWQKLRTEQAKTLADLVKTSYAPVFDAVDVSVADLEMLRSGFIHAFNAGEPQKPIAAFLVLCEIAGIPTTAKAKPTPQKATGAAKANKPSSKLPKSPKTPRRQAGHTEPMPISLQVVIPPEWNAEEIRTRIKEVTDAVQQVSGGT